MGLGRPRFGLAAGVQIEQTSSSGFRPLPGYSRPKERPRDPDPQAWLQLRTELFDAIIEGSSYAQRIVRPDPLPATPEAFALPPRILLELLCCSETTDRPVCMQGARHPSTEAFHTSEGVQGSGKLRHCNLWPGIRSGFTILLQNRTEQLQMAWALPAELTTYSTSGANSL